MNIKRLGKEITELGISVEDFSIGKAIENKFCLVEKDGFWQFFFLKKNVKEMFVFFETENEACVFFKNFVNNFFVKKIKWNHIKTTQEKEEVLIKNINIWDYKWNTNDEFAFVTDPLYGQPYLATIYGISINSEIIEFAACEFSNGVWGIYTKDLDKAINSN